MKKLLLLSLCLAAFTSNAQITWTEQNTNYPVSGSYTGDISVVDENVAWSIVQRVTATNHQRFSKTTDGGATWTTGAINVGNITTLGIGNISAVDANTAWISVYQATSTSTPTQGVYKTTNGGTTWTKQATAAFDGSSFCNGVYFWDANNGVSFGDPKGNYFEIYTTTNGGTNWTRVPSTSIVGPTNEFGYTGKFYVQGNTIWFGTDGGKLMRSTNRGLNWTAIDTPVADFGGGTVSTDIAEFAFSDDNNGFILKETYDGGTPNTYLSTTLYRTTNGGSTWTIVPVLQGMFHGAIAFAGPGVLITAGSSTDNFGSSYSTDNGATWTEIDGDSHTTLNIKSATLGYSGGFSTAGLGGAYKMTNTLSNPSFTASKFKVYPNPAASVVTISATDVDSYKLSVTDLSGKTVMTKSLNGMENTVDISNLSTGAYFFELNSNNKKEVVKILKN